MVNWIIDLSKDYISTISKMVAGRVIMQQKFFFASASSMLFLDLPFILLLGEMEWVTTQQACVKNPNL